MNIDFHYSKASVLSLPSQDKWWNFTWYFHYLLVEAARKRPCPLGQGATHVFWKGPVNLLGFAGLLWLCHKYSILPWQYKSSHPQYINKWAWLCPYKTLLMGMENWISYNVHVSQNAILPLTFFPTIWKCKSHS